MKLNLGCGKDIMKGYVNVDKIKLKGTDVVWDLEKFPYPFPDNHFSEIKAKAILEHLFNFQKTMEELWRISKPKAIINVYVPHFESLGAVTDPTHKLSFSYFSFDYYCKKGIYKNYYNYYSDKADFKMLERRIIYPKYFGILEWIVNKMPRFHEVMLRKFLPVRGLYFKLEVVK